jgi:His/Glu/Gln/Arg/opine family amino acid ABC transporter permease subunit
MNYEFSPETLWQNKLFLLEGTRTTLLITAGALGIGLLIGGIAALGKTSKHRIFSVAAGSYIEIFRNTPELVQLIWIYYCVSILVGLNMEASISCLIALGLNSGGYMAEVLRAGIQTVHSGEIEAARGLGLSKYQVTIRITLPQAIRTMIPPLVNQSIIVLKNSSLVSVLGVMDLTFRAQVVSTNTFKPIEMYTAIALIYFVLCTILSYLARLGERRLVAYR